VQDISSVLREIREGNEIARTDFISSRKEFIRNYASFVCKKSLDWSNDDELSVALEAFNDAVDKFDLRTDMSFYSYARLLMRNSLIDYFRRQPKVRMAPLSTDEPVGEISWLKYKQELDQQERVYDIQRFKEEIGSFDLSLGDLVRGSPHHTDTRESLRRIASRIAGEKELVTKIYRQKKLPLKEIEALTGMNRKTLEYWRKYLLSLIIVLTQEELSSLKEYIQGKEGQSWKK
jgi:RNA polymerase sigma factor